MKNLKMFAIAVMAFAVMAMGVHATTGDYQGATCSSSCHAVINGTHQYTTFAAALKDAQDGDTITLLAADTVSAALTGIQGESAVNPIKKNITVNVNKFKLDLATYPLYVGENGSLTITGTKDGEVTSQATADAILVADGGSLTIKGALKVNNTARDLVNVNDGKVTVSDGATLSAVASTGKIVEIGADGATVSLNAKVGTKTSRFSGKVVDTSAVVDETATITFEGGEYYTSARIVDVAAANEDAVVTINNGTYDVTGAFAFSIANGSLVVKGGVITSDDAAINVEGGDVLVSAGTLKCTGNHAVINTQGSGEGSLEITGGQFTLTKASQYSPLYFGNGELTYAISGGDFAAGKKDVPAVFVTDTLLTGLDENGLADHFKGMLTGGKYLYSIIGGTADGEYSSAVVTKYVVGEGLEVRTEGDYKVIGTGTPADEPGTTEPGDTTIPPVPQTNDNILVYAGLGLVSLASVAFTAKKRED